MNQPASSKFKQKLCVVESRQDVMNNCLFIDVDTQSLTLRVDADDAISALALRSYERHLARDTVHVNARLKVLETDEAGFHDEVNNARFLRHWRGQGEVIGSVGREVDFNRLFEERWVRRGAVNLDDLEL